MKIGFIGAGKVGFSLGKFLSLGDAEITGYYSKTFENAKEAAQFTNSYAYNSLEDLTKNCDTIFITVPDNFIQEIYEQLCKFKIKNKIICHTSGVLSAKYVFHNIESYGAYGLSIHPLFPISSKTSSYKNLKDAFFCLEGNTDCIKIFDRLLTNLGSKTQIIEADSKSEYHAGCVIASNFMCGLINQSIKLLENCGFTSEEAKKAIEPLVRANIDNIFEHGTIKALTGPIERCDTNTIKKHLSILKTDEEYQLYISLSKQLLKISQLKNKDRDYKELIKILEEERNPI
ncbi:MAG: hypothetical protein BEN19_00610 [Epulopiscium sp. Nuni2H_MBin003]|nr:MAG: hypothetical protein BEN19_00610 [Epulopiscium sp. Nuni2H_MBin003]